MGRPAADILRELGGTARTRDLIAADVHPRDLYAARDAGDIVEVSRGLFRLASLPNAEPDLVAVVGRVPKAVVCGVSALHLHGLTEEIPRAVHIALPRGTHAPRLAHPPLEVYWVSAASYRFGVEQRDVDGVLLRITTPAKTVADAFKFRSRIGSDVAVSALREALRVGAATPAQIAEAAAVCRVANVVRPYLEAFQ